MNIPLAAAVAWGLQSGVDVSTLAGVYRLGDRFEVELDAVESPDTKAALLSYWTLCTSGQVSETVVVRRTVRHAMQDTSRDARRDLSSELAALDEHPFLHGVVDLLCAANPDVDALRLAAASHAGSVVIRENDTIVSVLLPGILELGEPLGGIGDDRELARVVTLRAKHAAWRDRRARRLAEVTVESVERWPRI